MILNFETVLTSDGFETPLLVASTDIHAGVKADGLRLNGRDIALDAQLAQSIANTIGTLNDERLPEGHFRDCVSFALGICGVWLPTHATFDTAYSLEQECDEVDKGTVALEGPISSGILNDGRCLGFGNARYVYSHMSYGLETDAGNLVIYRDGTEPQYCLEPLQDMLAAYEHEVAHPVKQVQLMHREEGELVRWERT